MREHHMPACLSLRLCAQFQSLAQLGLKLDILKPLG
jgi:hypothetical protein